MSADTVANWHASLSRCQVVCGVPMRAYVNDAVGISHVGEHASPHPRGLRFLTEDADNACSYDFVSREIKQ